MTSRIQPRLIAFVGAAASAAALAIASPAANIANAHGHSTPSGDAVGRPGLDNPAPVMRFVQALGDKVFNQSTAFNISLDESIIGVTYHAAFGSPNYEEPTHGSNGSYQGGLNSNAMLKDLYDGAQERGFGLPDEEELPGTLIRNISGIDAAEGNHHDASAVSSSRKNSAPSTRSTGSRDLASKPKSAAEISGGNPAVRPKTDRGLGRAEAGSASRTK